MSDTLWRQVKHENNAMSVFIDKNLTKSLKIYARLHLRF